MRAFFATVVALVATAAAQPPAERVGLLFGRVLGPEQKPVPGATVRVLRSRLETLPSGFDQNVWDHTFVQAEVRADELGKFRVELPEGGIYGVTAQLGDELMMGIRNFVRVGDSLTLELQPTREVRGQVAEMITGKENAPRADVVVRVLVRPDYGHSMYHGELLRPMVVLRSVRSDGEGKFRVVVPTGEPLHLGVIVGPQRVYTKVEGAGSVDVLFGRGATLYGRVVDADTGEPVVGAAILDGYQSSEIEVTRTDANGAFTRESYSGLLHVVPRGHERAFLQVSELGEWSPDDPQKITVAKGLTVTARLLRESGEPLVGARYYVAGPIASGGSIYGGIKWQDRTGEDGRVRLGCLQPGQWIVGVVEVDGIYVPFVQLKTDVDVDLGDLRLSTATGVEATVLDPEGAPRSGAVVFVLPAAGEGPDGRSWLKRFGITGPRGRVAIRGLLPGRYDVAAAANGLRHAFAVCDASAKGAKLSLKMQRGEAVRGRVLDAQGRPVAGAHVSLHQINEVSTLLLQFGLRSYSAITDERGHFSVGGLPAEALLHVQVAGVVDGEHVFKPFGEVQVGDGDLELKLTK